MVTTRLATTLPSGTAVREAPHCCRCEPNAGQRRNSNHNNSMGAARRLGNKNKDGKIRFCVHYRRHNAVTKHDVCPMPTLDEALDRLHRGDYFTSPDLLPGYPQMPLETTAEEAAFTTPDGVYQCIRLLLGLTNPPATFKKIMNNEAGIGREADSSQGGGGRG